MKIGKSKKEKSPVQKDRFAPIYNKKRLYVSLFVINLILIGTVVSVKIFYHSPAILMNQVGFLPDNPKSFFIKSDFTLFTGYFQILDENNSIISDNQGLTYLGKLWGSHYYKGDFSNLTKNGNYTLRALVDHYTLTSPIFEISKSVYDLSLERAYEFLYYQRSGCQVNELITGYSGHGMDHADDYAMVDGARIDLTGGWFSAGDYSKHTLWGTHIFGAIYASLFAYEQRPELYNCIDLYSTNGSLIPNNIPDILDEAMWGVQYAQKLILFNGSILGSVTGNLISSPPENDTDQINDTADDRTLSPSHYYSTYDECMWLAAGLAKFVNIIYCTKFFSSELKVLNQTARNIYATYSKNYNSSETGLSPIEGAPYFVASYELGKMTGKAGFYDNATWAARAMINELNSDTLILQQLGGVIDRTVGLIIQWALETQNTTDIKLARDLVFTRWSKIWQNFTSDSGNFYNLIKVYLDETATIPAHWSYFQSEIGQNNLYLYSIYALTMGYNITGGAIPQMKEMISAMIDWIFGKNPDGISMMEGIGAKNLPSYHHRYRFSKDNPRGAVPGAIPNGYILRNNRPYIDLRTSKAGSVVVSEIDFRSAEPWIVHNVAFLYAMSTVSKIM